MDSKPLTDTTGNIEPLETQSREQTIAAHEAEKKIIRLEMKIEAMRNCFDEARRQYRLYMEDKLIKVEGEREALRLQLDKLIQTHETISYQLGYAIIQATKSWRGFFRLPSEIIRMNREARRRRKDSLPSKSSSDKEKPRSGHVETTDSRP
jgi:hypothetical protein